MKGGGIMSKNITELTQQYQDLIAMADRLQSRKHLTPAGLQILEPRPEFNPFNLIFCDETGNPIYPDIVSKVFREDREQLGLPSIRFHDLRHGHATMLLEAGEDLKVISDRLGHSTIAITADIYAHVCDKMQREASHKLEQLLDI